MIVRRVILEAFHNNQLVPCTSGLHGIVQVVHAWCLCGVSKLALHYVIVDASVVLCCRVSVVFVWCTVIIPLHDLSSQVIKEGRNAPLL